MKKRSNRYDLSIILPTYNEANNIVDLIREIFRCLGRKGLKFEVIVVDDDSADGTYDLVVRKYKNRGSVRAFIRKRDHGLARSILLGIKKAKGKTVLVMDSDFNHNPAMIWQMYKFLSFYDVVIGSRFVYSGGMEDALRNKFSFLYNLLVRILLGTHIQDNLSGFFAIKKNRLLPFSKKSIFSGYGEYFIRFLFRVKAAKYKIIEVPVYYQLRRHGTSKSNFIKMLVGYTMVVFGELVNEVKRKKSITAIFDR